MLNPTLFGKHTEEKLGVLSDYLKFYSTALHDKGFVLAYIDAFAGTGFRSADEPIPKDDELDLQFSELNPDDENKELPGSASLALSINPPLEYLIL